MASNLERLHLLHSSRIWTQDHYVIVMRIIIVQYDTTIMVEPWPNQRSPGSWCCHICSSSSPRPSSWPAPWRAPPRTSRTRAWPGRSSGVRVMANNNLIPTVWASVQRQSHSWKAVLNKQQRKTLCPFKTKSINQLWSAVPLYKLYGGFERSSGWYSNFPLQSFFLYIAFKRGIATACESIPKTLTKPQQEISWKELECLTSPSRVPLHLVLLEKLRLPHLWQIHVERAGAGGLHPPGTVPVPGPGLRALSAVRSSAVRSRPRRDWLGVTLGAAGCRCHTVLQMYRGLKQDCLYVYRYLEPVYGLVYICMCIVSVENSSTRQFLLLKLMVEKRALLSKKTDGEKMSRRKRAVFFLLLPWSIYSAFISFGQP